MLVSYKWLSKYVDVSGVTPEELAEKITRAGIEVDMIHYRNKGIQHVVVGYVKERVKHPDADKLSVCQVDVGEEEPVQIVCGAANVDQGQKVAVAKVGAVLPGDFKIKKAKLRGQKSEGMICSAQELGIEERLIAPEFKSGIMVLPEDLEVGSSVLEQLDLDDVVLELDVLANRSDCLSMLGVAYEVAAILGQEVTLPSEDVVELEGRAISEEVKVSIQVPELCPHYVARKVTGVSIGPSPLWLQNRLISSGIRPINNVVDVTNYVMLEYGQPLHAFDAQHVKDGHIVIREAVANEKVVTLDDQERGLTEGMLLITDPEKVIAVAGVMGAANSEVTEQTKDVILESAYFSGLSVRVTSKALGLRSEASARFEKGVDPERVYQAIHRAAALLQEVAGAQILLGIAEERTEQLENFNRVQIPVHVAKLNKVLGTVLNTGEVTNILDRLGFEYENKGHEIKVEIPTRRPDLRIQEDMMEEVARLYGYDRIPITLPAGRTTPGSRSVRQQLRHNIKRFLQGTGLNQVTTYSLTSATQASWGKEMLEREELQPIALSMPMSEERSHLRTSLIPSLIDVALYNKNRTEANTHIFEIGHVFLSEEKELTQLPTEEEKMAGLLTGIWQLHPWQQVKTPLDFFVAKGIIEGLFEKLDLPHIQFEAAKIAGLHPGRSAKLMHDGTYIGYVGQLHPKKQLDLDLEETYVFEISLELLLQKQPEQIAYQALPKYPSMQRDIAVVVDQDIPAGKMMQTIEEAGVPLLKAVRLFDVYEGEKVLEGKKSIAFSLQYFDPAKTLTDEEVKQVHDKVVAQLEVAWGAALRK
ncbi:phenylalanine--tRNA ligase subunit beta [Bacillus horti]|uniref:Phenylalanine--tRNA ligase beta subunit n=1 Tax=Caldalkalibacillus horti TaxID=77523 RepID=A0ABT9VXP6_9BACI|nr:phenylalanine--tRNA ligase subunit beta [Bacillus horti]MDQ0165390.1 phenylalanyl-tRNA synthetase beta chain [Bacillus horti]